MVSSLVEESFYYKPAAEAFKFIHNRLRTQGDVPDWTGLTGDPSISEDTRKILRSSKEEPAISKAKVQSIVDTLEKYRKLRALVEMAQGVLDRIEDKELDLDDLVEDTTNKLTAARQRGDTGTALHHIGKGNNTVGLLKEMLYGKKKPSVPTGFKAFDDRNGGILLGSLWTIGANTGGGKTAMAVNVLRNMTEFALEDCCFPKGTLVDTVAGPKPIESLMPGENVYSFNKTTRQVEVKPVTGVSAIKSNQRLVRIRHAGGVFECTEDHEIWCDQVGAYVKAGELKPGMKLTINTSP